VSERLSERRRAGRPVLARVPSAEERARATTVKTTSLRSIEDVLGALPDPATLAPRALVLVPAGGARTLARSLLAMLGRDVALPRVVRCSALVAKGYVDVGAARTEDGEDVAWGYAPTGPC